MFGSSSDYFLAQISDIKLVKTELKHDAKWRIKGFREHLKSEVLLNTKECLLDFCETDQICVAALTKQAIYIIDKFSTHITKRVPHLLPQQKGLFLISNFDLAELPLAVVQEGDTIQTLDICGTGTQAQLVQ